MSRAVFLSNGGDPFLGLFVIKLWRERWQNEVNKFWVHYNDNSGIPVDIQKRYISKLLGDPQIRVIYHPTGVGNGRPITEMTLVSQEDLVMLLEDDGFIFTPGVVDKYFKLIESNQYDVIGSPRFSCGQEIAQAARDKWNLDYSGYGDKGCNFWPNFFFCKRADLLKTDLNFASKRWNKGEKCPVLSHEFLADDCGDTFVWASLQLRNMNVQVGECPQHKADPYEIDNKRNKTMNWIGDPMPWIHGGSLSAGLGGYLSGRLPDVSTDISKQEMESRVAFWIIVSDTKEVIQDFFDFRKVYRDGLTNLVVKCNLDMDRVNKKVSIYREVMKL